MADRMEGEKLAESPWCVAGTATGRGGAGAADGVLSIVCMACGSTETVRVGVTWLAQPTRVESATRVMIQNRRIGLPNRDEPPFGQAAERVNVFASGHRQWDGVG